MKWMLNIAVKRAYDKVMKSVYVHMYGYDYYYYYDVGDMQKK